VFTLKLVLLFVFSGVAFGEVHSLTFRQALEIASQQNPDAMLARLDEQRAIEGVRVAQDPFRPKVYGGSGLAYTYGYPNTIEGNAPSLFQARTDMALYNRPKSYQIAEAEELARGSRYGAQAKAAEAVYEAADLFLTATQVERQMQTFTNQIPDLQKVVDVNNASLEAGSILPIEVKRAEVNLAVAQQKLESARLDADYDEMTLAVVLGYPATDRVKPTNLELRGIEAPASEQEAADAALRNNRELRQMQSNVLSKQLDLRSYKASRLPQVDLVAQYALFARYNYEYYFPSSKFQRNNFQLGAAVTIPLLLGPASKGLAAQAVTDMEKIRIQMDQVRNRVLADTRRSYEQWKKAESMRDLTRMQLDLAREQVNVLLAQNTEGRIPLSQVEQARVDEGDRWMALYDAEAQVTRAKLAILRQMGTLLAEIRSAPEPAPR